MPPPSTSLSTLASMLSMTEILEETFDPPTMAAKGRLGTSTAPWRYSSSFCSRNPDTEGFKYAVTPMAQCVIEGKEYQRIGVPAVEA